MTFEEITRARRSINFFDPERDVSEELLKEMVELAARTPSSFNLQPWNLVVLRDQQEKEEVKKLAWDQPKVVEAPVILAVLGDKKGWSEGHPVLEKNWQEMLATGGMQEAQRDWFLGATNALYNWNQEANLAFAAKNAGFFSMSLMYAATALGLESHPMDGFDHEGVRSFLKIPDDFWVVMLLAVGYRKPGLELQPAKWRKSYEEIAVRFS